MKMERLPRGRVNRKGENLASFLAALRRWIIRTRGRESSTRSARDLYAEQRVRARAHCQRVVVLSVGLRVDHLHCRQLGNVTAGVKV